MNDEPTCGECQKVMTPENSTAAPEYFLCDDCAVKHGFGQRVRHEPTATELQLLRSENCALCGRIKELEHRLSVAGEDRDLWFKRFKELEAKSK